MNKISFLELGATLFVPANHKNLQAVVSGEKYPSLKSVVIDTEDGITQQNLSLGLESLKKLLVNYKKGSVLVFVRTRDIETLKEVLFYQNILEIDGFVLPKFGLNNAQEYLTLLEPFDFFIMPSIEGQELFHQEQLHKIKDILIHSKLDIQLVRFGLEDLFRQLRMKNSCSVNPFDRSLTSSILSNFIAIFKSAGFGVSGGVYRCFRDDEGFIKNVERDVLEGLMTKTIIHPNQIELTHNIYKVSKEAFNEALEIMQNEEAVFSRDAQMMESVTMHPYAKEVVLRSEIYGVV